jgi:RNA polymerase sigma-32 factor
MEARVKDSTSRYLAQIAKIPLLDASAERELARRYREYGDRKAAHRLIEANLRIAARIAYRFSPNAATIEDACQQANMGLIRAVETYDERSGYRFTTYAGPWIRSFLSRWLDARHAVHVPRHRTRVGVIYRSRRPATYEELAELAEISLLDAAAHWNVLAGPPLGFDVVPDEGGEPLVQRTAAPSIPTPDPLLRARIAKAMAALDERERDVICARYLADVPETLEKIGERHGVTRERIRQIERDALETLRIKLARTYTEAA